MVHVDQDPDSIENIVSVGTLGEREECIFQNLSLADLHKRTCQALRDRSRGRRKFTPGLPVMFISWGTPPPSPGMAAIDPPLSK